MNFKYCIIKSIGEWLNGRVAVSKTVGCVFESRLPCQKYKLIILLQERIIFYIHNNNGNVVIVFL